MATSPNGLPQGMTPKPSPEDFEKPVAWLFGRQFIATFKYVLLYTAFKGKLDSRDWMHAEVREQSWKESDANSEKEFWFDYISDTGDGQKAMYSVAYLCLSDLYAGNNPQVGDELKFAPDADRKTRLPRGAFLFVGGDTSYHISDYASIANRFQNPFWWAYNDLPANAKTENDRRLLFGIPANHDYYDALDGFNRQFRRPSTGEDRVPGRRDPLLMLPTFERTQEASYVALQLPFGWWFWGLDSEAGEIDFRQLEFFNDLRSKHDVSKLILATPEPTISFGKLRDANSNQSKTFAALGLERPFLKDGAEQLPSGKCRVDLSGDIHHYARYFGPKSGSGDSSNYTSVMAGGGGAFFHPSQTTVSEVEQKSLYPPADSSRNEIANQLFKFINIWNGGYVQLFGFLMAFSLFFTAYFPKTSREAVNSFPPFVWLGISPGVASVAPANVWAPKPLTHYVWTTLIIVSLGLLAAALIKSIKLFRKQYDPSGSFRRTEVPLSRRLIVWALVAASFVALAVGLQNFRFESFLHPYFHSGIVFAALIWAVIAVVNSVIYSGWLFEESYRTNIQAWHYWPIWALLILAAVELGAAFWFYGRHPASYLISDLVQLMVVFGVFAGFAYFAVVTGGHLYSGFASVGFLLLGIVHAFLQLLIPFLLVRKGHLIWAPLAALVIVVAFQFIGARLAKLKSGLPLAIGWVLFAAALLIIPFVLPSPSSINVPDGFWPTLFLCLYAGAIGAMMSCVLFGSYLGVALGFNGHNNEAGGAARIEGFKQLIRFRLTPEGLTGYVIGIDEVKTRGADLNPRIVDIFRICAR
jgi:hypothetical protein